MQHYSVNTFITYVDCLKKLNKKYRMKNSCFGDTTFHSIRDLLHSALDKCVLMHEHSCTTTNVAVSVKNFGTVQTFYDCLLPHCQ